MSEKNPALHGFIIGLYICMAYTFCRALYYAGFVEGYYYVEKRLVKKGNILQYPFGKKGGKTTETSDSDCVPESGKEPEKE